LDSFVGEAWELTTGLSHRSDLDRDAYNHLARYVAPELIAQRLRIRYGAELDDPQFHHGNGVTLPIRIARQFMYVHARVLAEPGEQAPVEAESEDAE
jgi:hypothetical protein